MMGTPAALRALLALLVGAMLLGGFSTDGVAQDWSLAPSVDGLAAQVVVNPAARSNAIGPARNWDRVDPAYRYYYGPNHRYDAGWYAARNVANPNLYVAYASDPGDVCSTEYYYMPDDGLYYCYTPDPVALNSNLQGTCPNQPYLYICPN
jgi:hypothetical protein